MSIFEGEFKKKPIQSLGGASKNVAKESLLNKAYNERKQRELIRKQNAASIKLQAVIRSYYTRKYQKNQFRELFDIQILRLKNLINDDTPNLIYNLLKKIVFFYDKSVDDKRLLTMAKFLISYINDTVISTKSQNISSISKSPNLHLTQIMNFFNSNIYTLSKFFILLIKITNIHQYAITFRVFELLAESIPSENYSKDDINTLLQIYSHLCQYGYFQVLLQFVNARTPKHAEIGTLPKDVEAALSLLSAPIRLLDAYDKTFDVTLYNYEAQPTLTRVYNFQPDDTHESQRNPKFLYLLLESMSKQLFANELTFSPTVIDIVLPYVTKPGNTFPLASFFRFFTIIGSPDQGTTNPGPKNFWTGLSKSFLSLRTSTFFLYSFAVLGLNALEGKADHKDSALRRSYFIILGCHLLRPYLDDVNVKHFLLTQSLSSKHCSSLKRYYKTDFAISNYQQGEENKNDLDTDDSESSDDDVSDMSLSDSERQAENIFSDTGSSASKEQYSNDKIRTEKANKMVVQLLGTLLNSKSFVCLLQCQLKSLSYPPSIKDSEFVDAIVYIGWSSIFLSVPTSPYSNLSARVYNQDAATTTTTKGLPPTQSNDEMETTFLDRRLLMILSSHPKFLRIMWTRVKMSLGVGAANSSNQTTQSVFKSLEMALSTNLTHTLSSEPALLRFSKECELLCLLLSISLTTLQDEELTMNTGNNQPSSDPGNDDQSLLSFRLRDILELVKNFKELSLVIVGLLFPPNANLLIKQDWKSFYLHRYNWVRVFKSCASLLKQIRTRFSRNPFCSPEIWLAKGRFMLENSAMNISSLNIGNEDSGNLLSMFNKGALKALKILSQAPTGSQPPTSTSHGSSAFGPSHTSPSLLMTLKGVDEGRVSGRSRPLPFHPSGSPPTFFPDPRVAKLQTLLCEIPFVIPFHDRVKAFRSRISADKSEHQNEAMMLAYPSPSNLVSLNVRRNYIYEDSFEKLSPTNEPNLKLKMRVHMTNAVGLDEAGIDGGGIFREFLTDLLLAGFDPNRGLFIPTKDADNSIYPNPNAPVIFEENFRAHYYFLGRMLGKALYENLLVEIPLAYFFIAKLLSRSINTDIRVDLDDLASLDPVLYRNVIYVKRYTPAENLAEDLQIDFSIIEDKLGKIETVDLIPNGSNIPVDADNRIQYVYLLADYKLNKQIGASCKAFRNGVADVIDLGWLRIFDPREVQTLISGTSEPIDIENLRANTSYSNGYDDKHPVIVNFWKIVHGFTESQLAMLLKFVTSCSRPPLLGFKELHPSFCIQNAGPDPDRLPTASTCMNLLKLPQIKDPKILKQKILYAIYSYSGFELS